MPYSLPYDKRNNVKSALLSGKSICQVSKLTGVTKSTVSRIRKELPEIKTCIGTGRPSRVGHLTACLLRMKVRTGALKNVKEVQT
ncbi:uncharacterized protein B0P05DRAFT_566687, partial [Gilbertella persicaria]|uniref:uncharacterized protein n=1 Tax=Gilbertella persicaria TaxID=101096 RepID=UPI00221EF08C